jgi:hypothetical protein
MAALVISVLYRNTAIPVAWVLLPENEKEAWNPHWLRLLERLKGAVPEDWETFVLCDRGLWSPALYDAIRANHWHPGTRVQNDLVFCPEGLKGKHYAKEFVPKPGTAWIGRGQAFKKGSRSCVLAAVWLEGQREACYVLTDAPPAEALFYSLRFWIEPGFRTLKSLGLQWESCRRTGLERSARHLLVLAISLVYVLATGTREEDAEEVKQLACHLHSAPSGAGRERRVFSLFRVGLRSLQIQILKGRLWKRIWLRPSAVPPLPKNVVLTIWEGEKT